MCLWTNLSTGNWVKVCVCLWLVSGHWWGHWSPESGTWEWVCAGWWWYRWCSLFLQRCPAGQRWVAKMMARLSIIYSSFIDSHSCGAWTTNRQHKIWFWKCMHYVHWMSRNTCVTYAGWQEVLVFYKYCKWNKCFLAEVVYCGLLIFFFNWLSFQGSCHFLYGTGRYHRSQSLTYQKLVKQDQKPSIQPTLKPLF